MAAEKAAQHKAVHFPHNPEGSHDAPLAIRTQPTARTSSTAFFPNVAPWLNVKASPKHPQSVTATPAGLKSSHADTAVNPVMASTASHADNRRNTPESRSKPSQSSPAQRHTDQAKGCSPRNRPSPTRGSIPTASGTCRKGLCLSMRRTAGTRSPTATKELDGLCASSYSRLPDFSSTICQNSFSISSFSNGLPTNNKLLFSSKRNV